MTKAEGIAASEWSLVKFYRAFSTNVSYNYCSLHFKPYIS